MQTITLEIKEPETVQALVKIGHQRGKEPEAFILDLLAVEILAAQSFDEIAAPIRADFRRSGMTEEYFDELIEQARQANWEENQKQR